MQVLEGYLYLGNLQQLGAEIATAFTNALDETCLLQVGLSCYRLCVHLDWDHQDAADLHAWHEQSELK